MNLTMILGGGVVVLTLTNWVSYERLQSALEVNKAHVTALDAQKRQASFTLAAETEKVRQLQAALKIAADTLEKAYARHKTQVADATAALTAARKSGRLRDPNAPGCGRSGADTNGGAQPPPPSGGGDQAETSGLLSVQLSDLLGRLLREADDINIAYAACRPDALSSRGLPAEPPEP